MIQKILKIFILIILISGAIASTVSIFWTLVPDSSASKECMLGYKAHCTFTPISTIILIFISIVFSYIILRTKFLRVFD
jgi:hypothetical protein